MFHQPMSRRGVLSRAGTVFTTVAATTGLSMSPLNPTAEAATADVFKSLKKSPRMPVLFLGHGSPMNSI